MGGRINFATSDQLTVSVIGVQLIQLMKATAEQCRDRWFDAKMAIDRIDGRECDNDHDGDAALAEERRSSLLSECDRCSQQMAFLNYFILTIDEMQWYKLGLGELVDEHNAAMAAMKQGEQLERVK